MLQKLRNAGEHLAAGDSEYKVDTRGMYWDFKRHGENLNRVGEGIAAAVARQMKSERLKTELITNVSHDIKTPLTSILNYVDLLSKEHLEGRGAEYLEVLDRQANRLKKLTEDLVEASKASTGNLPVNLARTDVCELVRQAAGEYTERLANRNLESILTTSEEPLFILADGRLLWRVLDNLLGNVCKYALPGTRVYLDVTLHADQVILSVKNISRDRLNVDAEELIERFVRGEASRTTEGSGLGLNIARSLTELQKGIFRLAVDGDLFKAELQFQKML
jgi:signal transduction histidine kinase